MEVMEFAARGIIKAQFRIEKMDKLTEVSGKVRNMEVAVAVGDDVIKNPIDDFLLCRFFKR